MNPDSDPQSIAVALAEHRPRFLQFSEPLPEPLLNAAADALARFPEVDFRVYGRSVDPSLDWMERFAGVRALTIDLWYATSFDVLAGFKSLRRLSLGQTASKRPSLGFVSQLPELEVLRVEAHDRDFDAVGDVTTLRQLSLRAPRTRTLDPLRGHARLEVVEIDFGAIRDLTPLAEVPRLRGLELYQIRRLDTDELRALGGCESLVALSLGALRNVTRLDALTRGPRRTLRYLTIERMTGLETLGDLAECEALEQVYIVDAKPKDRRLDLVARSPSLRHLVVGDHYARDQLEATDRSFTGETLSIHGKSLRGDPERRNVAVRWRRNVTDYFDLTNSNPGR